MDSLLERDRQLIEWSSQGATIKEMAEPLEISHDACERAKLRAFERLRKAYHLMFRSNTPNFQR